MLSDKQLCNVKDHIANCDDCRKHYDVILMMIDDLHNVMEVDLPKGFKNRLHFALERELMPAVSKRKQMIKRLKIASAVVGTMVVIFGAVSIVPRFGSDKTNDMAAQESMPMKALEMEGAKKSRGEEAKAVPEATSAPREQSETQKTDEDTSVTNSAEAGNGEANKKDGYSALSYARDRHIESVEVVEEAIAALKEDEYLRLYINSDSVDKDNFIDSIFDEHSTKSTYWIQFEHKTDEYIIISRYNQLDIAEIIYSIDTEYLIENFGIITKEQLSDYEIDINEYMTDDEYILIIFIK